MHSAAWIAAALELAQPYQNAIKRPQMEAYMRDQFPFLGITAPERKIWFKQLEQVLGFPDFDDALVLVKALLEAGEREMHYLAIHIVERKKHHLHAAALPLIEMMIITKGWWDTVDWVSVKLAGGYFKKYPTTQESETTRWSRSQNLWLRRSSLLFCLKYKDQPPWHLLEQHLHTLSDENEFFIQKAIGWVLREKSKTHPEFAQQQLATLILSNLAVREGSKYL